MSMKIEQIRVGSNFSYVIYCESTKQAVLVDPGYHADYAIKFISSHNLSLKYVINTHHHSDHTAESSRLKKTFKCKIIASGADKSNISSDVDLTVIDGEELMVGEVKLKFILTPGHTHDGLCIIAANEALLTGDTLFIGDCGRCDLPGSSLSQMFHTLQNKIKTLPDHLIVYPGHDYGDKPFDTLGNQKLTNKTLLVKTIEEFSKIP
jgi:glyoxylase-like metal-dependent hydrolase (beta-lactamase superfamily II)